MILPKDGMQRELECSRLTVEHDWLQEDSDRIGDRVADTSGHISKGLSFEAIFCA